MSLAAAVAMLLALREAARLLTPLALGTLLLARRVADLWANLVQAGTPHALRRYIPLSALPAEQHRWLEASILLSTLVSLLFLAVMFLGREWLAPLTLGQQPDGSALLVGTALLAIAAAATNMAMSALIAFRHFVLMNLLQVVNGSVWLLAALWLSLNPGPNGLVLVQAIGGLALAAVVLVILLLVTRKRTDTTPQPMAAYFRETASYGVSRTISPFLEILLLVIGPWLLRGDPASAGGLILAFTLLRLTSVLVQPLAMVGSVTGAQLMGAQDQERLSRGINLVIGCTAAIGLILCAAGYPWIETGLRLWLGDSPAVPTVERFAQAILLVMMPYLLFQGLKPVIEAVWRQPWVLYIMLASLVLLILGHEVLRRFMGPADSLLIMVPLALAASGLGTLLVVRHMLRSWSWFGGTRVVVVAGAILALNLLLASLTSSSDLPLQLGVAAVTLTATVGAGLWLLLTVYHSPCLVEAVHFLLPGRLPSRSAPNLTV
jgi:hypothetical protein